MKGVKATKEATKGVVGWVGGVGNSIKHNFEKDEHAEVRNPSPNPNPITNPIPNPNQDAPNNSRKVCHSSRREGKPWGVKLL